MIYCKLPCCFAIPKKLFDWSAETLAAYGKLLQNEYCRTIQSLQSTFNFSRNKFHDFLPDIDINYFFMKPVDNKLLTLLTVTPTKRSPLNKTPTPKSSYRKKN